MSKPKRVIFIGDTHCGSLYGLTPPAWQAPSGRGAIGRNQAEMWDWFAGAVKAAGPFDMAVWMGDLIDGGGRKSHGVEEMTTNELTQLEQAECIVRSVNAKVNKFVLGTPYHVGEGCDFEALLAQRMNADYGWTATIKIGGVAFNVRHHSSRSSVPYGMLGAAKEKIWNELFAVRGDEPRADVVVRAHVHWYRFAGQEGWLAMSLPSLELPGTKYGARCSGDYTVGFVVFELDGNGGYSWQPYLAKLKAAKAPVWTA